MAKFFIDRPVFAWVIAIVIMMAGALSIFTLPVEQYPRIAPPSVAVSAYYPGASAKTLEDAVTQVIEQKMNGIDHFRYMSSTSDSSGNLTITITFDPEADPDIAQVQVQNKLQLAIPLLPLEVQKQGVKVNKSSKSFLMVVGLVSMDGRTGERELTDFIASNIQDPISRVSGVGEIMAFGAQHAMRVWLDPIKLENYQLTTTEVVAAIEAENAEVTAGQLGGTPAVAGQQLNATVLVQSRMQTPEEFASILLRVNTDGSQVRLGDVAHVEMGSETYDISGRYNEKPAGGMAIRLATGANALDTANRVRARMDELKSFFPQGVEVIYPYDTTPFVKISIEEVVKTLAEAIILVFLVMYVFLQNLRATLIPTIAVPVVLLGTFGVLAACGFSINTLTMFGMVLAIGLLVDDAIVVVENVERIMSEEGLPPREATRKSMTQITGALVGIALVLSAVFVPMAFFSGSTGAIYRQFSLTVVSAMALSVLVALVLTPALCATLLKPVKTHESSRRGISGWFNRGFDRMNAFYLGSVHYVVRRIFRFLAIYVGIAVVLGFLFLRLPTAFLPDEDQGILLVQLQLPAGATKERTLEVMKQVERHFLVNEKDSVKSIMGVAGFSFAGQGQNAGLAFVMLKDWDLRDTPDKKVAAVAHRAMVAFSTIKDAMVFAFPPPAIVELGTSNGFDFELLDRGGLGHDRLTEARNQLLRMAAKNPDVAVVRPNGMDDTPQFRIVIDRKKASAFGLSLADVNNTLSTAWGSAYVNDFIENGRVKKAYLQADARFRMLPSDVNRWYVRNAKGEMVPFSSFSREEWAYGSPRLERYNGVSSMEILGSAAPGKSSGDAMAAMEKMAAQLPAGIGYEWTGLSFEERLSGSQAPALYAISVIIVFLCLAALYESWTVPVAVILVVPLGVIGAVAAVTLRGLPNDIYFQVGLLTTVGLSAKNAILIVEFAKSLYDGGMDLIEATALACRQRLRPILMTSFAFILGVLPLAVATGAGSGSQNAIGVGVMGGMISATVLAIFFVPVFFVAVMRLFRRHAVRVVDTAERDVIE
ncbi:efflux RND transporter permease subunit [Shumkonia mesophila]|uniref:efflux RND transporter permease subunit n=1 Tax=Shumkonia mesophila TaxID=2838854 RepID=UPI0029348405|nr:efflux RND transporter permease subunit [Shumkonia mesophila]